ncbi:MAG: GNAT family N-acetyltransferase, partial [Bacteroidota bacterium]
MQIDILTAQPAHAVFAQAICDLMAESAKARGTGIATRKPEYVAEKLRSGKAVIALIG